MKRNETVILGVALCILLGVVNFLASRHFVRLDLTQGREYTLAPSTKALLRDLDDLVTIRVYFTRQLPPALLPLSTAVNDILAEYKSYAGKMVQLEYPDPQATPQQEQEVQILGINPVQLNVVAKDKREVARVYLGMTITHGDKQHVIPVVDRAENLEYELTAGILRVSQEKPRVVGWWGPATIGEGGAAKDALPQFEAVRRRLQQRYTLRTIAPDGANVDVKELQALVIAAPRNFTAEQQFVIDQYLASGGKVMALIDRMEVDPGSLSATAVTSGLESLFAAYGVTLNADLVADASNNYAAFGGGGMTIYRPYPFWPVLHRPQFDATHPTVARLEQLTLPWVSSLTLAGTLPEGLTATVLVHSSAQSAVTTGAPPIPADPDSAMDLLPAAPSPERPLAVWLTGTFTSAFGRGTLAVPKGRDVKEQGSSGGQLLVVGTSRIIEDRSVRQFADGVVFFENGIDYLALGEQLIGIRSRAVTARPLVPLSDAARVVVKYLNTFGVPVLVIAAGLVGMAWRRARRRALQIAYTQ